MQNTSHSFHGSGLFRHCLLLYQVLRASCLSRDCTSILRGPGACGLLHATLQLPGSGPKDLQRDIHRREATTLDSSSEIFEEAPGYYRYGRSACVGHDLAEIHQRKVSYNFLDLLWLIIADCLPVHLPVHGSKINRINYHSCHRGRGYFLRRVEQSKLRAHLRKQTQMQLYQSQLRKRRSMSHRPSP